jgi:hypothetical protein
MIMHLIMRQGCWVAHDDAPLCATCLEPQQDVLKTYALHFPVCLQNFPQRTIAKLPNSNSKLEIRNLGKLFQKEFGNSRHAVNSRFKGTVLRDLRGVKSGIN